MQQVRAFVAANALAIVVAAGIVVAGAAGGLALGGFLNSRQSSDLAAVPSPSATAGVTSGPGNPSTPSASAIARPPGSPRSPTPTRAQTPDPLPTSDATPFAGPDGDVVATIGAATAKLYALERFRFASAVSGRSLGDLSSDSGLDMAMRGSLVRRPDLALDVILSFSMVEPGGVAAVSSSSHGVSNGDRIWEIREGEPPRESSVDGESRGLMLGVMPDGIMERAIVPFASGYELVGEEQKSGVVARHYRATEAGLAVYRHAVGVDGACAADVWIAVTGGHPVAAKIACEPPNPETSETRGIYAEFEVTDAGDPAIVIDPPN